MADKYRKPCLDSSVFLGGLRNEIAGGIKRSVVFRCLWESAKSGAFPVFISAIAIAEVYKKRRYETGSGPMLDEFLECINEPFVEVIEVDRETALQAHYLCRKFAKNKLLPNDGIHLACALRAGCDVLLAWDGPLVSVIHGDIRIEPPQILDRTLFTECEIATPEEEQQYKNQCAKERGEVIDDGKQEAAITPPTSVQGSGSGPAQNQARAEGERTEGKKEDA